MTQVIVNMIELTKKQEEEWIKFGEEASQRTSKDPLQSKEFGTGTKRKRRCGWFDANLVKQSVIINGIDNIVLTKLDILDYLEEMEEIWERAKGKV